MPALVDEEYGVYNTARGCPWWGPGRTEQQHLGFMTAEEVILYSKLGWLVEKVPMYVDDLTGTAVQVPDAFAVQRQTDGKVLGVVGNRYVCAQNTESLSFMDYIIGQGQAVYDTAWSLRGGKTVCLTAELNQAGSLPKDEEVRTYITAMNNHDGSGKIRFVVSPIRVVCMNTLNMAVKQAKYTWEHKHTASWNSEESMAEAREVLNLAHLYQEWVTDTANLLIGQAFPKKDFIALAKDLLIADAENITTQERNRVDELLALYVNSDNLGNIRRTKWGALNAVVEFVDYAGRYRGEDKADKRTESILFGRGVDLKTKAYDLLVAA